MNKAKAVLAQKISNSVLRKDNGVLKKNLHHLIQTYKRNAQIQQKIDEIAEMILGCEDFRSIIMKTTDSIKSWFGLSAATYCLTPEFRELLGSYSSTKERTEDPVNERLFFMDGEKLTEFFMGSKEPVLRGKVEHGSVHFFDVKAVRRIRSEALIPLHYGNGFIGSLNLGSNDPLRYQEGAATDYLNRLARMTTLSIYNVYLKSMVGEKSEAAAN